MEFDKKPHKAQLYSFKNDRSHTKYVNILHTMYTLLWKTNILSTAGNDHIPIPQYHRKYFAVL